MATFPRRVHPPGKILDYPIDLSDFAAKGDPAVSVTATISDGPTIVDSTPTLVDGIAVARVNGSGMVLQQHYTLNFDFELASGQTDDRNLTLYCDER